MNNTSHKYIKISLNVFLILYTFVIIGIIVNIILSDKTFFMDEAMLALSVINRSFAELVSERLVWEQSAPVIYLYLTKTLGYLGSYSEISLRISSFISYIVLLIFIFFILKRVIPSKLPLLGCALLSSFSAIILYANEFKPYLFDAVIIFGLLILRWLIEKKGLKYHWLALCFAIAIWASNPSCFMIAAILLLDTFIAIRGKNIHTLKNICFVGVCTAISFITYYYFWLKPVIDAGFMSRYWGSNKFNFLFFTSKSELNHFIYILAKPTLSPMGRLANFLSLFFALGSFIYIFKGRNKYVWYLLLTIISTLIASSLGMYPITYRLLIFIFPILSVLFSFYWSELFFRDNKLMRWVGSLAIIAILVLQFPKHFTTEEGIYLSAEEFKPIYKKAYELIGPNDTLYVEYLNTPVFLYLNQYDSTSISSYKNNVIFGKGDYSNFKNVDITDFDSIKDNTSLYIIPLVRGDKEYSEVMKSLDGYGKLTKVYEFQKTPLYHYTSIKKTE